MTEIALLALTIAGGSVTAVLGALFIFAGLTQRRTPPLFAPEIADQDAVFVFRGTALLDSSDRARKLLEPLLQDATNPRDALLTFLHPHFGDLQPDLTALADGDVLERVARDGTDITVTARVCAGLLHLRLVDPQGEGALLSIDRLSLQSLQSEVQVLRDLARTVPVLCWMCDEAGHVVWANDGYLEAASHLAPSGATMGWPLPALFDLKNPSNRLMLELPGGPRWFAHRQEAVAEGEMHFATPIDSAVQSELARREMMQMLTRTFASLPIGLALFDAERRLQVFNPALVDLTGLDPFFLAARPDLGQFLHTLRELRMLPEPKDFSTWRDELIRTETAAAAGQYNEEWVLQSGRIYQVKGCPQPNGALAFFVQDVTSEATLLRGFRAEIEFSDMVMDAMPDAVAAFDRNGRAMLANAAYIQLWGNDPCGDLSDIGLEQAQALWIAACDPSPAFLRLAQYLDGTAPAESFSATATLRSGGTLAMQARLLPMGGVMVYFRLLRAEITLPRPPQSDPVAAILRAPDMAEPAPADLPLRPRLRQVRHVGTRLRN
jgi:PAS domain-containing protein